MTDSSIYWPKIQGKTFKEVHTYIQQQLAETQFLSPQALRELQMNQLRLLVEHALPRIPFYYRRFQKAGILSPQDLNEESWNRLPVLTRKDIQENEINTPFIPETHGRTAWISSSGSTGVPTRMMKSEMSQLIWTANVLRDEMWNRSNNMGTVLFIRHGLDNANEGQLATLKSTGIYQPTYGAPSSLMWDTGQLWVIDDRCTAAHHAEIIARVKPEYIFSMPSNLRLLLKHYQENGGAPKNIRSVWTASESVADLRDMCREILGCRIVDNYSCAEAGYLALQCPEHDHYHIMSETVRLEVLHPDGTHCKPGEVGKVVITPLHNFVSPLFRYDIGDEAEVGDPCPCGRCLPVLKRIIGRTYDYLTLPNGRKQRVDTGYYPICAIRAVRELQIIQRSKELVEVLLVLSRPLKPEEEKEILELCLERFGSDFTYKITPQESIERTTSGKRRIFISEIS
jgi:phenylacetate-CoA ligase